MPDRSPELRIGSVQLLDRYDQLILYPAHWQEPEELRVDGKIWAWIVRRKGL